VKTGRRLYFGYSKMQAPFFDLMMTVDSFFADELQNDWKK
jgi:hypothetical protein